VARGIILVSAVVMIASLPSAKRLTSQSGFSLLESAVATTLAGLFLSMLMVMSSNVLGLLRTSKDNVSASQALQERVEQMRIANWLQITDSDYLADALLAAGSDSAGNLGSPIETVTVSAYPAKAGFTAAQATRQNGTNQVISSNAALKDERMVRVDISLTWKGFPRNRQRVRATTALIAKGGIAK
jgi:hypothetical protein